MIPLTPRKGFQHVSEGGVVRLRRKGLAVTAFAAAATAVLLGGTIAYAVKGPAPGGAAAPAAEVLLSQNKPVGASSSGGCGPAPNPVYRRTSSRRARPATQEP